MKKLVIVLSVIIVAMLMGTPAVPAEADPSFTIELLNPPKKGLMELAVGETYTFDIEITSYEPFVLAIAMTDAYYPGRDVFWHGSDRAIQDTSAMLHLTMTGKSSTDDLTAVCDWPEPADCWPEGVAPVSIVVGVHYKGGLVVSEIFPFAVIVP